jgi:hypothetical protein
MRLRLALGALLIALAMTAWLSASPAQDGDACRSACREQQEQCMDACSEHSNAVECDSDCRSQGEDCLANCD